MSARGREWRQAEWWDTENESERWEQRILVHGPIRGARDEEDTQAHTHMQTIPLPLGCALENNSNHFVFLLFFPFYLFLFFFLFPEQSKQQQRASANKELNRVPRGYCCTRPSKSLTVQIWPLPSSKSRPPMLLLCLSGIPLCQGLKVTFTSATLSFRIFRELQESGYHICLVRQGWKFAVIPDSQCLSITCFIKTFQQVCVPIWQSWIPKASPNDNHNNQTWVFFNGKSK